MLTIVDIIIIIILAVFIVLGLFKGLIRMAGSIFGIIVAAWIATHYYLMVSEWIQSLFFGRIGLGKVIVFILIFIIINRLVSLVFMILDGVFDIISIIPFLGSINRLGGALLGFLEGILALGLILYIASRASILNNWLGGWLVDSEIVPFLLKFVNIMLPFLPEALKQLKAFF